MADKYPLSAHQAIKFVNSIKNRKEGVTILNFEEHYGKLYVHYSDGDEVKTELLEMIPAGASLDEKLAHFDSQKVVWEGKLIDIFQAVE